MKKKPIKPNTPTYSRVNVGNVPEVETEVDDQLYKAFQMVADNVSKNYKTFTVNTIFALTRGLDLEFGLVSRLFTDWAKQAIAAKRIKIIPSCDASETLFQSEIV
jgi:hypothetical protein